jgi:hypothetical protein
MASHPIEPIGHLGGSPVALAKLPSDLVGNGGGLAAAVRAYLFNGA